MINFSEELNAEQLRVVNEGDGPCLVLAGAGSGKTRTITYRVAHLLEQGVKPENILLVTFTNKAAEEMKKRVAQLALQSQLGTKNYELGTVLPWSGTFHHIGYRILRIYAPLLGYKNNFTVLDSDDSEALLKLCIKEVNISSPASEKRFPSASVVHSIISYARNAETTLTSVLEDRFYQHLQFTDQIKHIAEGYERRKKEANAMDFDDLLTNLLKLLTTPQSPPSQGGDTASRGTLDLPPPYEGGVAEGRGGRYEGGVAAAVGGGSAVNKVLQKYATQFQYVLVDEYQDTNKIQASIIKQFSSIHHNLVVVGDDAQSIYSFRAADIQNILQFPTAYPGAKIFKLETNYRSTENILELANDVIANNREQYKKNLRIAGGRGGVPLPSPNVGQGGETPPLPAERPQLWPQMDQQSEGNFLAAKIEKLLDAGTPPSEIAVLFRASHHSQMLEVELVRRGIDYDYRGGVRFFERAHIKDILSYLRILSNIADTAAWLRVLLHEEGIGPAAAQKLIEAVRDYVERASANTVGAENLLPSSALADIGNQILGTKALVGWNNFLKIWEAMRKTVPTNAARAEDILPLQHDAPHTVGAQNFVPSPLIDALTQSPYRDYLDSEFIDSRDRLQDIKQLALFAEKYDNLEEFLADATLQESYRTVANETTPQSPPSQGGEAAGRGNLTPPYEGGARGGKIVLSTIHQAKGLEWSAVFIINLSNGSFPSDRALREANGIEEERRLFYVAITRAKKQLYLTYPMAGGAYGDFLAGPSLFLNEITPGLLDDHSLLSVNSTVLDDPGAGISYVSEDEPPKRIRPGSFLMDIEDL